mmetsp:Transcript_73719/g.227834  ORF Transcript_73719/g.227834 Transcript_73719/m.227834 type:complete len:203 (+) Transcript_73719:549-1157(+)
MTLMRACRSAWLDLSCCAKTGSTYDPGDRSLGLSGSFLGAFRWLSLLSSRLSCRGLSSLSSVGLASRGLSSTNLAWRGASPGGFAAAAGLSSAARASPRCSAGDALAVSPAAARCAGGALAAPPSPRGASARASGSCLFRSCCSFRSCSLRSFSCSSLFSSCLRLSCSLSSRSCCFLCQRLSGEGVARRLGSGGGARSRPRD